MDNGDEERFALSLCSEEFTDLLSKFKDFRLDSNITDLSD